MTPEADSLGASLSLQLHPSLAPGGCAIARIDPGRADSDQFLVDMGPIGPDLRNGPTIPIMVHDGNRHWSSGDQAL
ncbi:hypothetical protein DPPLL_16800 [Desulfofustis limnaeus]|uniref:Uncharacterized protein n=1 Tax=Desulfofustis limnaeus TaxID=2740163 RepID=A0ABM7W8Q2_9BACT|nr:hypothetical protein DPPLL_16800 [Desulfofustis limnaeus]